MSYSNAITKSVLIVAPCFTDTAGGIETHINALLEAGVSDRVVVYENGAFFENTDRTTISRSRLKEIAKNYDTVWIHHPRILLQMRWHLPTKALFNSSHGFVFHGNRGPLRRAFIACKLILARLLGIKVVCVSHSDYSFGKLFGAAYLPNFCRFETEPFDCARFADRSGIVCVGRYSPHKRIDKVADFVKAQGGSIPLTVVCPSQDVAHYRRYLDAEFYVDLSDEELKAVYRRARYFISLSDFEGFGLAAIEAIALGCLPILSLNDAYDAFRQQGLFTYSEEDTEIVAQLHSDPDAAFKTAQRNQKVIEEYQISRFIKRLAHLHVI